MASALGGKKFQYWGMNCPETVAGKYQDGYRWFEADIKLTTDWKLVCVNGWTKAAFQKLGYKDCDDSHEGIGISYSEFMKGSYYDGHYPVMDFDMLISTFSHYPDTKLILDARSNTPAGIREIADIMKEKYAIIRAATTTLWSEFHLRMMWSACQACLNQMKTWN